MNLVFNEDLKMNYNWLPKGISASIINDAYIGSKSLIAAFWSDGEYIWKLSIQLLTLNNLKGLFELLCITKSKKKYNQQKYLINAR